MCDDIFIMMGGENLKQVTEISSGNIIGIGGLDDHLFNMGTLSTEPDCPSFVAAPLLGAGLIEVAVEPINIDL